MSTEFRLDDGAVYGDCEILGEFDGDKFIPSRVLLERPFAYQRRVAAFAKEVYSYQYGVSWHGAERRLAETGYVFGTIEQAMRAGRAGLTWFQNDDSTEIDKVVGVQVDWMEDSAEAPIKFIVEDILLGIVVTEACTK